MENGELSAIIEGIAAEGAQVRVCAILYATRLGIRNKAVENGIKRLKTDETSLFGYNVHPTVADFAMAALDILGIERYSEEEEEVVKKFIECKLDF